jgi:hypothetical protein
MEGYNIALKVNGKTLAGRTQDDLNIAAKTKDSLTKDDKGNANETVTGHDVTLKAAGLMDNTSGEATKLTRDEVIALSLLTGDAAKVQVKYGVDGGKIYGGNAIITGYTESTNAQGEATYGLDLKISGEFKEVTA